MLIRQVRQSPMGANCYLLVADGHALVVDPASSVADILDETAACGATLDGALLTHGHFDHVLSIDTLRDVTGIPVMVHASDACMLTDGDKNAYGFFFGQDRVWRAAETLLSDGDVIPLGSETVRVLHTPGHSLGSVCYLTSAGILTGDTLFAEDVGRWDLYGGSPATLAASIRKLSTLPDANIYPGHGTPARLCDALENAKGYFPQ